MVDMVGRKGKRLLYDAVNRRRKARRRIVWTGSRGFTRGWRFRSNALAGRQTGTAEWRGCYSTRFRRKRCVPSPLGR
ncbi:MAG: hypothetical protein PVH89_11700, partial [Gammaproteobacteria bacterium]